MTATHTPGRYKIGVYCAVYEPGWYYLEGIPGRGDSRRYWETLGWEWVRGVGRPGLYRSKDAELVRKTTILLGVGLQEYREDRRDWDAIAKAEGNTDA